MFIPEGLYVPTSNPQITGVAFGTTQIKATALAFGPDTRDVTVALTVTLTPAELDIPELWTKQVTAQLSAPAPSGGVTLELSLDEPARHGARQRLHPGRSDVERTDRRHRGHDARARRPSAPAAPASSRARQAITMIETPDVYLSVGMRASYPIVSRLWWGWICRSRFGWSSRWRRRVRWTWWCRCRLGRVCCCRRRAPGSVSESLVVDRVHQHVAAPDVDSFYVQGTIQGDDVDDDVPVTIDVFETGTTDPGRLRAGRQAVEGRRGTVRVLVLPPPTTWTRRRSRTPMCPSARICSTTASRARCTTGV